MPTARLAFLFLTMGDHHQGPLWEAFLAGQPASGYRILCHAAAPGRITQPWLGDHLTRTLIPTRHADISLVRAILLLLQQAFEDAASQYFILLSESCVPLYPMAAIRDVLVGDGRSRLLYTEGQAEAAERWPHLSQAAFIPAARFLTSPTWMILTRDAVAALLEADYTALFEAMYAPDEHYFANVLAHRGFPLETRVQNRPATYANWTEPEREVRVIRRGTSRRLQVKLRPKTYQKVAAADVAAARDAGALFFRKVSGTTDCAELLRAVVQG